MNESVTPMTMLPQPTVRGRFAFSLVEVALAMGLFSFALVALLGLMPVALQSMRDSIDLTTATHLADGVAARLQEDLGYLRTNDWSQPLYFNDLGEETGPSAAIYQLRVIQGSSVNDYLVRTEIIVSRGASTSRHFCYLIYNHQ